MGRGFYTYVYVLIDMSVTWLWRKGRKEGKKVGAGVGFERWDVSESGG